MKVYLFYIYSYETLSDYYAVLPNEVRVGRGIQYALYAWTRKKRARNIFRNTRNMDLFYEKEIYMDDEEFSEFQEIYDESELLYYYYAGDARTDHVQKLSCEILSNTKEHDLVLFCGYDKFEEEMSELDDWYILHLKELIRPKIYLNLSTYFDFENIREYQVPLDDCPWRDYVLNQMEMYNTMFANTYKKGGVYKNALLCLL